VLVVEPSVFSVVTVFVPSAAFETVVVFFPVLSVTTVVVTPSSVEVLVEEPSPLSVAVDTLPSASVVVVTVLPLSYDVTHSFTPEASVVHVGPLVTFAGASVVVLVLDVVLPGLGPLTFTPLLSNCSHVVEPAAVVVHTS
jgi:hypothetical protein